MRAAFSSFVVLFLAAFSTSALAQDGSIDIVDNGPFRVELVGNIVIDASIEAVWEALIDVSAYGEWNPSVLEVTPEGADVTQRGQLLDVTMALGGRARVQRVEVLNAVAPGAGDITEWVYRSADFAAKIGWLKVQRQYLLETFPDGSTRLTAVDIFTGFVWAAPVSDTAAHLEQLMRALAVRAEALTN